MFKTRKKTKQKALYDAARTQRSVKEKEVFAVFKKVFKILLLPSTRK